MSKLVEALSPGMLRAIGKLAPHSVHGCGFTLPKYPGRYPKNCPNCNEPRVQEQEPRGEG